MTIDKCINFLDSKLKNNQNLEEVKYYNQIKEYLQTMKEFTPIYTDDKGFEEMIKEANKKEGLCQ
ncbi:hypothetical protein [uncultured Brachyspira sp.]|uniref:hypothetical protein n=1 Tax=uncultured Brachyspira sp. TaxID=221953 RepID=UPI0025D842B4|nr:hypothetical protein [uncultured Brachyspira sp.]